MAQLHLASAIFISDTFPTHTTTNRLAIVWRHFLRIVLPAHLNDDEWMHTRTVLTWFANLQHLMDSSQKRGASLLYNLARLSLICLTSIHCTPLLAKLYFFIVHPHVLVARAIKLWNCKQKRSCWWILDRALLLVPLPKLLAHLPWPCSHPWLHDDDEQHDDHIQAPAPSRSVCLCKGQMMCCSTTGNLIMSSWRLLHSIALFPLTALPLSAN